MQNMEVKGQLDNPFALDPSIYTFGQNAAKTNLKTKGNKTSATRGIAKTTKYDSAKSKRSNATMKSDGSKQGGGKRGRPLGAKNKKTLEQMSKEEQLPMIPEAKGEEDQLVIPPEDQDKQE